MDNKEQDDFLRVLEGIRTNAEDTVDLNFRTLHQGDVKLLAVALKENCALRTLRLREALRGEDVGAKLRTLAPAFETSRITDLDLSWNRIDQAAAASLATYLKGSSARRLQFCQNRIAGSGAASVADALKVVPLTDLDLSFNDIGDDGAKALAASLAASSVTALTLRGNLIGQSGVEALAQALRASPVTGLFLGRNLVGNEGAKALASALKNSSLKVLSLSSNDISDEGVKALAACIPGSSIQKLNLSHNPIGNEGAKALAAILRDSDIDALGLNGSNIDDEGWKAFLKGVGDTAVTSCRWSDEYDEYDDDGSETLKQLKAVLEANKARTFVLQMQVEGDEVEWTFTFRTMAGSVAAVVNWSSDRCAKDLPEAVFEAMRTFGFQLPDRHLRAHNLRILRPDGQVLDVGDDAGDLAQQLESHKRRRMQ